jgi:hypothetical protein
MVESGVPHLRLVRAEEARSMSSGTTARGVQEPLFPDPSTVLLVGLDETRGEALPILLERLRPLAVIDLRALPRFDFGRLDRKRVFALFRALAIEYLDAGLEPGRPLESSEALAEMIHRQLARLSCGPVVVLVDARSDRRSAAARLSESLRDESARWVPSLQYG